jgi:putative DNA primase/helicase
MNGVLGPYAMAVQFDLFLQQTHTTGEGPTPLLAGLAGARFVSSVESEQDRKLAVALVKQMTGGDPIRARVPFAKQSFQYVPSFKICFVSNHELHLPDDDDAAWRRIHAVPFTVRLTDDERDDTVKLRLSGDNEHCKAILAWAARGCMEWQEKGGGLKGLDAPTAVRRATAECRSNMDPLSRFLDDCCDVDDPLARESFSDLWTAFG